MIQLPLTPIRGHEKYASPEFPLRASSLPDFVRCAGKLVIPWVEERLVDTLGGAAAQTGNLLHAGAAGYHQNNNLREAGEQALEAARVKFPGGDYKKAVALYAAYIEDKENQVVIDPAHVEVTVHATFAPEADDPTGLPIVLSGHADQIRRHEDGELYVWDIKTGSRLEIKETLDYYAYQLSAYSVAATQTLGVPVNPGGIIYTEGYSTPKGRRRIHCPWYYEDALRDMRWVVRLITEVRKGNAPIVPGETCKYCPLKSITNCKPKYKELIRNGC